MRIEASFSTTNPEDNRAQGNQPVGVVVGLPDWGLGGRRQKIELTLWEALQLKQALNEMLP